MKKKLLLHVCCAPCAIFVHRKLAGEYDVTCFFYNPNIHPIKEYGFRKKELERIAAMNRWNVIYADYDMKEWFRRVKGHEKDPERGERCSICFHMRLQKTFEYGREKNFDIIAATLTISPYKAAPQVNAQGEALAGTFGIPFLSENFKKQKGYDIARKMAREMGIKQQNYCGCVYSRVERKMKLRKQ